MNNLKKKGDVCVIGRSACMRYGTDKLIQNFAV